ncbi:hypothetical protein C1886_13125 [Pseudomonas sp. FW300-N1A1]|uniref:hypothetical protein n=1 Tax=Pseudomonas sp. FW300-N1A1 TaxID=2075555 RepID=UPI000CD0CB20|nr:hypothetical protein [Pseudomonas sp. FW300-N1A1]POA19334.1 hypothetical protein C1886_13125 [Pseudomonas sp. FW300-N1A1]
MRPASEGLNPYRTWVAKTVERPLCSGFETVEKKAVFWSVVCWETVKSGGERSIVHPFSTEQQAQWAAQVLTTHYPGPMYALLRQISEKDVETAQMEVFERSVVDDVVALELADKHATAPD